MKLTSQDALEYMGTLIIILTGIPPAAAAADVILPNWLAFTIAVAVMALAALQKQYQRKLEAQPSEAQAGELAALRREVDVLRRTLQSAAQFVGADRGEPQP